MKIIFSNYQPQCKMSGVEAHLQTSLSKTKYVAISLQLEEMDNIKGYNNGDIVNVPGKYLFSEITNSLTTESKEMVDQFIKELKSS